MTRLAFLMMAILLAMPPCAEAEGDAIISGCSGGVTGGGGGVTVTRDGRIVRWQQERAAGPRTESLVRSDAGVAASLFAELEAIEFGKIQLNKPGNMTCSVTWRSGARSHTVAWPMHDRSAPPAVLKLYERMRSLAAPEPTK